MQIFATRIHFNASQENMVMICQVLDPIDLRIPISLVLFSSINEDKPYNSRQERKMERNANIVNKIHIFCSEVSTPSLPILTCQLFGGGFLLKIRFIPKKQANTIIKI